MTIGLGWSVLAHGMVTAVGDTAAASCAAFRASVSGVEVANLWDPTAGARLSAARPRMHQWSEGALMIPEIIAPAIAQCVDSAVERFGIQREEIPILILLSPPWRPRRWDGLDERVLSDLPIKLGYRLPAGSCILQGGRTGMVDALRVVQDIHNSGGADLCIIVGAESFLRQTIVDYYLGEGRLLCATNSNGFIPGEGACAVLLGRTTSYPGPALEISGVGENIEPSRAGGDGITPVTGEGLTGAVKTALDTAGAQQYDIAFSISDLNGERFKFKEAVIAYARVDRLPPEGKTRRPIGYMQRWHPIESAGEIGAAIFPCMLGWAFEAGRKGYAPSQLCLLHASEDDGTRAAMVTSFRAD
jgi:3-oxoacyl-[acyl-carrier-protein] synthase I